VGCDGVRWQGETTLRASARKEKQRRWRAPARLNRVRCVVTIEVTLLVRTKAGVHKAYPAEESGQLRFPGLMIQGAPLRLMKVRLWLRGKCGPDQEKHHGNIKERGSFSSRGATGCKKVVALQAGRPAGNVTMYRHIVGPQLRCPALGLTWRASLSAAANGMAGWWSGS